MDNTDRDELDFLRAYHQAISEFNRLDRNVAYCLRNFACTSDPGSGAYEISSESFHAKLEKLYRIIDDRDLTLIYAEFRRLASLCRITRNQLVHGDWRFVWHLPKPIQAHSPELNEFRASYTPAEFAAEMSIFSKANNALSAARRRPQPVAAEPKTSCLDS